MDKIAKQVVFTGRVQGIGFRFTALNTANRYGLTGVVRNRSDGAVEMIAQGPAEYIDDCIQDIQEPNENRRDSLQPPVQRFQNNILAQAANALLQLAKR